MPAGTTHAGSVSPTALVAAVNDYDPGNARTARLDATAARDINGLLAPAGDGVLAIIQNISAFTITLKHQNAGSAAPNRIIGIAAADVLILAGGSAILWYDLITTRWRVINLSA